MYFILILKPLFLCFYRSSDCYIYKYIQHLSNAFCRWRSALAAFHFAVVSVLSGAFSSVGSARARYGPVSTTAVPLGVLSPSDANTSVGMMASLVSPSPGLWLSFFFKKKLLLGCLSANDASLAVGVALGFAPAAACSAGPARESALSRLSAPT